MLVELQLGDWSDHTKFKIWEYIEAHPVAGDPAIDQDNTQRTRTVFHARHLVSPTAQRLGIYAEVLKHLLRKRWKTSEKRYGEWLEWRFQSLSLLTKINSIRKNHSDESKQLSLK